MHTPAQPDPDRCCRRDQRCAFRTVLLDEDGERAGWQPALLDDPADALCRGDVARLTAALGELPELVARLHALHLPSLAVKYRDMDISGGGELHPPIPLDVHADALIRLIDHEVSFWANVVAVRVGLTATGDWNTDLAGALPQGQRIQEGAQLLAFRVDTWLREGPREYEARSLGARRWDGHDEDTTTRRGAEVWCQRDGATAAVHLLDLHAKAQRATAGDASDWLPTPCGHCGARTVFRRHLLGHVRCRSCGDTKSDKGYDEFLNAALAATKASGVAC